MRVFVMEGKAGTASVLEAKFLRYDARYNSVCFNQKIH